MQSCLRDDTFSRCDRTCTHVIEHVLVTDTQTLGDSKYHADSDVH